MVIVLILIAFPFSTSQYLLIETHYSNPYLDSDVVDSGSGLRLYLAPSLRPISVGTWMLGAQADPSLTTAIPAGESNYTQEFPAVCTGDESYGIASGDYVTVYSVFSHMRK